MSRIIFIHGFGERESIFANIAPAIGRQQLMLNIWDELGNNPIPDLDVLNFSQKLIDKYQISTNDVIIGHSMGGWIAYHIKYLSKAKIIQIGSWSHPDRVIVPLTNIKIIAWLVRNGLYFNNFMKWIFVSGYNGKPSQQLFNEIFTGLITANKQSVINQLTLILQPVPVLDVVPELRIHAIKDKVIRHPREVFYEVPGDHFTLITHPETVIEPILAFLGK
jgi:hypothetical protein